MKSAAILCLVFFGVMTSATTFGGYIPPSQGGRSDLDPQEDDSNAGSPCDDPTTITRTINTNIINTMTIFGREISTVTESVAHTVENNRLVTVENPKTIVDTKIITRTSIARTTVTETAFDTILKKPEPITNTKYYTSSVTHVDLTITTVTNSHYQTEPTYITRFTTLETVVTNYVPVTTTVFATLQPSTKHLTVVSTLTSTVYSRNPDFTDIATVTVVSTDVEVLTKTVDAQVSSTLYSETSTHYNFITHTNTVVSTSTAYERNVVVSTEYSTLTSTETYTQLSTKTHVAHTTLTQSKDVTKTKSSYTTLVRNFTVIVPEIHDVTSTKYHIQTRSQTSTLTITATRDIPITEVFTKPITQILPYETKFVIVTQPCTKGPATVNPTGGHQGYYYDAPQKEFTYPQYVV